MILKARALANKQYISIIRLLKHCGIGCDGELNVPRIKKQRRVVWHVVFGGPGAGCGDLGADGEKGSLEGLNVVRQRLDGRVHGQDGITKSAS